MYKHLKNVAEMSKKLISEKLIENRNFLENLSYIIGACHDFGKGTEYFQRMLRDGVKSKNAWHSLLSAVWGYYILKNYLMQNYPEKLQEGYHLMGYIVISRHHGDLRDIRGTEGEISNLKDNFDLLDRQRKNIRKNEAEIKTIYFNLLKKYKFDWSFDYFIENFEKIYRELILELRKLRDGNFGYYIELLLLYSVLLDADKMDASNTQEPERKEIPPNIVDEYREIKFSNNQKEEINTIREMIYKEIVEFAENFDPIRHRLLSVELPTGAGKTLSSISLAFKMRDKIKRKMGILPRIIYSLPFLSIIEQNAEVINEVLSYGIGKGKRELPSNIFLIHHHLADMMYKTEEGEYDIGASRLLTEGWQSEIIITTFFQLFHTLFTNKNTSARKFHRIINSIIILDEVQNIPLRYWPIVRCILKTLSHEFNTWIILMTATMPLILKDNETIKVIRDSDKYYSFFNRNEYQVSTTENTLEEFAEQLIRCINSCKEDILVILNRVSAVKKLYKMLREYIGDGEIDKYGVFWSNNIKMINLSTHIIPVHRFQRILIAKKNDGFRNIVISTQLVEAGVDISSRVLFRDVAPFDSIVQAGGRCNRNFEYGKLGGSVRILKLSDKEPLWKRIYDPVLIEVTKNVIGGGERFEEKKIRELVKSYYEETLKKKSVDREIEEIIKKHFYSRLSEFRLIDETYPKVDVFIEIDSSATEVLEEYKNILNMRDPIERKNKMLTIKKRFYSYVISVPEEFVTSLNLPKIGEIYFVSKEDVDGKYDLEVGLLKVEKGMII